MALKDRVIHGYPCSIGRLLQELPAREAAGLRELIWDLGMTATEVFEASKAEGRDIRWSQIGKHRRGQCRCLPDER